MPDLYVIQTGLNGTEKILLEGIRKVHEHDKIQYDYKNPEDVLAHLKVYAE